MPAFISFARQIATCFTVLALGAFFLSVKFPGYPRFFGVIAVCLMAINALGSMYPLYALRGKNPFNVYLWGMLIRLALIGMTFITLVVKSRLTQGGLLAVTFTALFSFVVYLAVEIRHFLRHPESFGPA